MSAALGSVTVVESTLVQVAKALVIFLFVLGIVPMILLLERKLLGRFQARLGPNRVGPFGLLQPLADVLKLLSKEQSTPRTAVPWMMVCKTSRSVAPVNGRFPASISYSTTPNEKMSLRESRARPDACSGDIYGTVPRIIPG